MYKRQIQYCVKQKAVLSVLAVRNVGKEEAERIVDSVFESCYADLEPAGRRLKKSFVIFRWRRYFI